MSKAQLESLTPNIMVTSVAKNIDWYRDNLGFEAVMTVPNEDNENEFSWAMITNESVSFMLHEEKSIKDEYPVLKKKSPGGALTFFIKMKNIEALYNKIKDSVKVIKDIDIKFYGMKEFAVEDCNGHILTFAEDAA